MKSPHDIASAYLAAWNAPDEAARARALAGWAEDARYRDPLMNGEGRAGIAAMIAGARDQFPGHGFALTGTPDGHGSFVRFSWALAPAGGAPVAHGTDIVRLDANERIAEVIGFLDGTGP
jgi:hypothetical protein